MHYAIPLAEIVFDFFDQLKSRTKVMQVWITMGPVSRPSDLVKVDILIQGETVDAFSTFCSP